MFSREIRACMFLASVAVIGVTGSSARAAGLLINGGFDTPTPGLPPPNYPASISGSGPGSAGPSSAADWTLYNNFDATTSTELLPSTDPTGGGFMMHLTSTPTSGSFSFFNGLQQAFPTQSGGTASVDVDVLSGVVLVALYANGGGTLIDQASSSLNNQWETLTVSAPAGTNPDLIVIYADNATPGMVGEFYADGAGVVSVPEPAGGVLALAGIAATAVRMRRAGRRSRPTVRVARPRS